MRNRKSHKTIIMEKNNTIKNMRIYIDKMRNMQEKIHKANIIKELET